MENVKTTYHNLGFTLIEVLISFALGALVIVMALQFTQNNSKNHIVHSAVTNMQENARFTLDFLSRELRLGGYAGCVNASTVPVNVVTNSPMEIVFDEAGAIRGFNGSGAVFDPALPSNVSISQKQDTDAILIQRTGLKSLALTAPMTQGTEGDLVAQGTTDPEVQFQVGDNLIVSDCYHMDIFKISSLTQSATETVVGHGTGSNANSSALLSWPYSTSASIAKFDSTIFFIEEDNGRYYLSSVDSAESSAPTNKLVPDIEDLQVLFGFDSDDDDVANQYLRADQVPSDSDWADVHSIKLSVLVRSDREVLNAPQSYEFNGTTVTPTDKYLRNVYSSVIFLRNKGS